MDLERANIKIDRAIEALYSTRISTGSLRVGVDLGTAYIVLVVIDDSDEPVAVEMQYAQVLKDGLVVDYAGACRIVAQLKEKLEIRLGVVLDKAAIAVPPGTSVKDANTHRYVVESVGFEVTAIVDEPTAANCVVGMNSGVIVDIGGGTTGLSVIQDGEVVYVADEATGGTHVSLVISGHYHVSFEDAEAYKCVPQNQIEVFNLIRPVFEKMATIVKNHITSFDVNEICLVGGTCLFPQIEQVFENVTGIVTFKPNYPLLVTPLGIALCCER